MQRMVIITKNKMHDEVLVFYVITRFKYLNMDLLVEL